MTILLLMQIDLNMVMDHNQSPKAFLARSYKGIAIRIFL